MYPMYSAGDDIDRISALPDDLLHAILAGVGEATAVIRTAVLSKRWRRVWIHAQRLKLDDRSKVVKRDARRRFADFVDWVLACRGDADIGSLEISMCKHDGRAGSPERLNEWLRYAARRVVKSFYLELPHRPYVPSRIARLLQGLPPHDAGEPDVVLPSHGRMASITMYLSDRLFQLPAPAPAAKYEALTELHLCSASFNEEEEEAPGRGRTSLGDFVSSCCPRLRKLDISLPMGLRQLVIRSKTLEELCLFCAEDLRVLDVTAPSLRVLKLELCFDGTLESIEEEEDIISKNDVARIEAPRLEEIVMCYFPNRTLPDLDIHDMASVRRLRKLHLYMHGPYCSDMDGSLWLLENCPGVEHVEVSLVHGSGATGTNSGLVDLTTEGAAPFANVRSMVVQVPLFLEGHLVSSVLSLLSRCPRLRSLSVRITETREVFWSWKKCFCDEVDTWKFHQKFFLGSVEEVTIHGFVGAGEDMELLTSLFQSSVSIRRVTLHATAESPGYDSLKWMMAEDDEDDTETTDKKLLNIPCTDGGCWHFGEAVFTWTCHATPVHSDANSER